MKLACALASCLLVCGTPIFAQPDRDPADALPPELHDKLVPSVTPLPNEGLVLRSSFIEAMPRAKGFATYPLDLWRSAGGVVLDSDRPALTLHFYAQGIEAMTPIDKLWEGLPKRAETIQHLVDACIGQARDERRPIRHLIIAGHAGLPGCAAFGGTLHDCVFRGRLSTYQRRQLARLRPYLATDAEIELRQCVTGGGNEGRRLLTAVYEATGAATSSYLADFHFGDADAHPRVRVGPKGFEIVNPRK